MSNPHEPLFKLNQPKRVLTIITDAMINNLDVLGAVHHLDDHHEIRFHRQPQVNIRGTKVDYNFDILISSGASFPGFNYEDVLPPHRYVKLRRYDKFTQAIRLRNAVLAYEALHHLTQETHGHISVPTWFVGLSANRSFPVANGQVVVKPMDGARGVGQFLVDLNFTTLFQFQAQLSKYVGTEHTEERFKAFLDSFEGAVTYHSIDENFPGEGLQGLKEQGAIIQSYIPNVISEYRVITDHSGDPCYYQRRNIRDKESVYPQATGGGNLIYRGDSVTSPLPPAADLLFKTLCRTAIGPMNSIDLFLTETGWGIFEHCNQFGVTGIPAEISEKIHADFLADIVRNFYSIETPATTV